MYYYGRGGNSWHSGVSPALISTGRIGLAVSEDGVNWRRVRGPLANGAVMDPIENHQLAFDCVHVGCSDVWFRTGHWWMYYFGGDLEEVRLGPRGLRGVRMRTGLATSLDGITTFARSSQPVLDVGVEGEWDDLMVAWVRVTPSPSKWIMTYVGASTNSQPPCFAIGVAISKDGERWMKLDKALDKGAPGTWDHGGVGRHHIIQLHGQYFMFYEGVNEAGMHAIGLATSNDGIKWLKDKQSPIGEPGGPIFTPRSNQPHAWDNGSVAAPHVIKLTNDCFGLYYVGSNSTKEFSAMGLALSDGINIRSWRRINASLVVDDFQSSTKH